MKKLIIVESPSKANTLQKYLKDQGYKVIASKGHIRDLPLNELGIDVDDDFKIHDVTMEGKDDVIKMIKKEAEDADEIYLASDPDREGEKISQSISEILPKNKKKNFHRIMFNSVTKESILKALQKPGQINEKKCDAQRVRRILDRLVGYKISGILINKMGTGYSAGRVQSVALRIIVEREEEIKNFIPKSWYSIFVDFNKDNIKFTSEYFGKQILKAETLESEDEANKILDLIKKKDFTVNDIKVEDKEKKSTPPFTTSKLQQEASSKLKFDTKNTMQVAQKLYEGIMIREKGTAIGLITYMRTDSVRVEPKAIEDVRAFIESEYGTQYLPKTPNEYKDKKAGNVQDAHEAIRPTDLSLTPDKIRGDLSEEQYLLYRLIYNKFVASQMANALLEKTTIMLKCEDYFFRTTGTVTKFDGFTKIFSDQSEEKKKVKGEESSEDDDSKNLPKLIKDESLTPISEPKVVKQVESPPPRFTEATLVKELEQKGIGRPSTYASIISNILTREYVGKNNQRFEPTEKGTNLCNILVKSFPREMDIKFTANVEDTLDLIEDGKVEWLKFMKDFYPEFEKQLLKAKSEIVSTRGPLDLSKYKTGIKCKVCNVGEYMIRKGKNGEFLACSNYEANKADSCRSTQNFKKNKKGEISIVEKELPKSSDKKCPLCSRPMSLIKSAKGDFYGCSGYNQSPKCSCIIPITTTHVLCPNCKKGEIVEKIAKESKKKYWGCSNYVNCKQVYWNYEDFIKNDDEKK